MLNFLFTLGQAAAVVFLLYGAFLALRAAMPLQRKPQTLEQEQKQKYEMLRLKFML